LNICIAIIYHPSEEKQTKILAKYYESILPTFTFACDFQKAPEHKWRNDVLDTLMDDFRYVIFLDSDEVILRKDFEVILNRIISGDFSVLASRIHYYLSPDTVQDPQPPYCPSIVLDTTEVKFKELRNIEGLPNCKGIREVLPIDLHHLYYKNREWKLSEFKKRGILADGENGTEDAGLLSKPSIKIDVPDEVREIQKLWP